MNFKQFLEENNKLEEFFSNPVDKAKKQLHKSNKDALQKAMKNLPGSKNNPVDVDNINVATDYKKLVQAELKQDKDVDSAKPVAQDILGLNKRKGKMGGIKEGVYAGGDGIKKKIPFTQNSTLQKQAVGPKDPDAKEKTEEDDELAAAKERIKKLEKLTKELQKAADETNEVATDNIDATADNLIDKMAAKERDELKEAASDWEKMEAQLKQIDEGCVGGVCTMGGRADAGASGPMGSFGIAPMGQIGGLSMPLPMEQNPVPQVADRSTIYNFVKNNDLHRTNRDFALNALTDKFGNASTELSAILSDAILSDGDPEGIDQSYGYSPDSLLAVQAPPEDEPVDDHIAQATQMSNAWGQMEEKLKDL